MRNHTIVTLLSLLILVFVSNAAAQRAPAPASPPSTQPASHLTLNLGGGGGGSGGVTMKLVLIPAGSFMMGSPPDEKDRSDTEGPLHEVTISKPFYMGQTPVTQRQWKAVMGINSWRPGQFARPGDDNPVSNITWVEAMQFCNRLSARTGRRVGLPSEAQWEYACRAGSHTRFFYGDDPDAASLGDYAWFDQNSWNLGESYPHAAGQKKPNAWGLYDMHGNVEQWCWDWIGPYPANAVTDPTGPAAGTMRVLRGGSFLLPSKYLRDAWRNRQFPGKRIFDNGCRVAALP